MVNAVINIGGRLIGEGHPAFVIAEAGANHNGDLKLAKQMCDVAKEQGCDCIKFQTFTAEEFCADPQQLFTYRSQGREVQEPMIDLFRRLEFSREQWAELMAYCDKIGILFLTTVQDPPDLKLMLELGLKGIKIGSDDFDHLANLKLFAATGLPLLVSKGMATLGEVDKVVRFLRPRASALAMLHCVSLYPTDAKLLNIRQIETLRRLYPDIVWGFSDHSQGPLASTLAVTLGAKIIEKHFTLDRNLPGPDHWFSMDPTEMGQMMRDIRFAEKALGSGEVSPAPDEESYKKVARRRLVAKTDLAVGAVLDEGTVDFKRSSEGAFVGDWDRLAGRRLRRPIARNRGIDMADIDFSEPAAVGR
ncbi:MAG: N-acetylneuraminate synthase family protein [Xanthobacteraceae bacterium]|nr:N-acetylneuraminate synthase family protein [Xanthobacteraceae bacterium]